MRCTGDKLIFEVNKMCATQIKHKTHKKAQFKQNCLKSQIFTVITLKT